MDFVEAFDAGAMCLVRTVREVQAGAIHTCLHELAEHVNFPAARPHRADDLGLAVVPNFLVVHREACREDRHVLGQGEGRLTEDLIVMTRGNGHIERYLCEKQLRDQILSQYGYGSA